ncbi:hypothetical protein [Anaplasma phagocytophilum]|uniref:Uncharacterized protein n=2 Tax=Anaplasma phagocytophilum TaxID=948 RepID=A0A0F3Q0K0_ANAPH|nr:hypothetical protein [Anaplasma phagocytophilum]EOA62163.1 hypothetical protein CRT38_02817 [Anaplasma phagocytophilum str. CRT38]KDB57064.1 hypothetical protein P030_04270 [Anaplasma phagocytophilum str. CRT35]KJV86150.1 hypothetical protein APHCRT_0762 [Anaplasma phagocytophilum str. CRT53-1]
MDRGDADSVIESTLSRLDVTKTYAESFKHDVAKAFQSGAISEKQYQRMNGYIENFLGKISVYEDVFERIRGARHLASSPMCYTSEKGS